MFKVMEANDIQNMIINNDLESIFRIKEIDLVYSDGQRYSFYCNDKLVNSFEVTPVTRELDKLAMFEYMLGFIDAYIICNRLSSGDLRNKVS